MTRILAAMLLTTEAITRTGQHIWHRPPRRNAGGRARPGVLAGLRTLQTRAYGSPTLLRFPGTATQCI